MRARAGLIPQLLLTLTCAIGILAITAPGARAELPEPTPVPSDVIAPVHSPSNAISAPIAPVHSPIAPIHDAEGQWSQESIAEGERLTLSGEVHFEKHEAILSPIATELLDEVASSWQSDPPQQVTVVGHTDSDGETAYNQDLSERRAQAVSDYLSSKVPGVEFEVIGKGESDLLREEDQDTEEASAEAKDQNRRVVLTAVDS